MNRYLQSGPMFRTQDRHSSEPAPEPRPHQPEVDLLVDLARVSRVTVLYGDDTPAKERVVRAAVALLEQTASSQAQREVVVLFDTWDKPALPALHARILETVSAKGGVEATEFATRPLADSLAAWQKVLDLRFIIVLDRFERYLDLPSGRSGTGAFDAELTRIINEPALRANFLIAVEKSAEPLLLARYRKRIRRFADSSVRLGTVRDPIAARSTDASATALPAQPLEEAPPSGDAAPREGMSVSPAQEEAAPPRLEPAPEPPTSEAKLRAEPILASQSAPEPEPVNADPSPVDPAPPPASMHLAAGGRKRLRVAAIAAVPLALAAAFVIFVWPLHERSSPSEAVSTTVRSPESTSVSPATPVAAVAVADAHESSGQAAEQSLVVTQTASPAAEQGVPSMPATVATDTSAPPTDATAPAAGSVAEAIGPDEAPSAPEIVAAIPAAPASAAAPSALPSAAALSIYVRSEAQRLWAEKTIAALGEAAPRLIGVVVVSAGPSTGDVRYFRPEEREEAEQLARALHAAGFPAAQVKEIPGFRSRATPRHYEMWLAPAAETQ
jgi:hypothetical protein